MQCVVSIVTNQKKAPSRKAWWGFHSRESDRTVSYRFVIQLLLNSQHTAHLPTSVTLVVAAVVVAAIVAVAVIAVTVSTLAVGVAYQFADTAAEGEGIVYYVVPFWVNSVVVCILSDFQFVAFKSECIQHTFHLVSGYIVVVQHLLGNLYFGVVEPLLVQ